MVTGLTFEKTFRSVDKIDTPQLEEKTVNFSYDEGDGIFVFLDENNEELRIEEKLLGNAKYFLDDDMECNVLLHNNKPIEITLNTIFVEKTIAETEPGARGDTATNVTKPAKLDNGYEIAVPLFVNKGDVVRIDTRTGAYSDRVRKG